MEKTKNISIKEKKDLAKKCIDKGYSVGWSHQDNRIEVYIGSEYVQQIGWTHEIKATVFFGRNNLPNNLESGKIERLIIGESGREEALFIYPGGEANDRMERNPDAKKLYNDVRRIFH